MDNQITTWFLLAFILMQFTDALLKPGLEIINLFLKAKIEPDPGRAREMRDQAWRMLIDRWPLYLTMLVAGLLAWFSDIAPIPMFQPTLGKVLACLAVGLGPSFIRDLKPRSADAIAAAMVTATDRRTLPVSFRQ